MNKKKYIILSSFILFGILGLFVLIQKDTLSNEEYAYVFQNKREVSLYKEELQELINKTAKAFYYNREYMKYRTGNMPGNEGIEYTYRDFTIAPEELNKNKSGYFDDASFVYLVYMNALGLDLSSGVLEGFNIENGSGFEIETIVDIKNKNGSRLVLESDDSSYDDKKAFVAKYVKTLELGDIIVYTKDGKYHLALYLGNNECIYFAENGTGTGIYLHNVNNYLFPNEDFINNNSYYAIIRPINILQFNPQDKTLLEVPVNSLVREDDVYIRRYTDVGTDNVYRGEIINFTIEVSNTSDSEKQINKIVDVVNNFLEFVEVKDGIYDKETYEVSWNNIKLSAKETKLFTYSVKVVGGNEIGELDSEESVYGKNIIAGNAKVFFTDEDALELNKIRYEITNKYITDQEKELSNVLNKLDDIENNLNYGVSLNDYKTSISEFNSATDILLNEVTFNSFIYYNSFDSDLSEESFIDYNEIRDVLFLKDNETSIYTRNIVDLDSETSKNINNMVVDNLYGGISLNDNKSKMFSSMINGNYTYNNLVSGDIIISWDDVGKAVSYLIFKEKIDNKISVKIYSYSKEHGIVVNTLNERINKIVEGSSLYVVLRPSKVLDIKLKSVQIDPINLNLDEEKQIVYSKKPINASVHSISYSESNMFMVTNHVIKGIKTGSDMLKVTFNESVEKNVSVSVMLAIMGDIFVSNYKYDRTNKIFYVGSETSVSKILGEIKFVDEGYEARIVDSSYNEVLETINDDVSLEVRYGSDWIGNYKIVYYSLDLNKDVQILENEKIIRYVTVGTKVKDFVDAIHINTADAVIEIFNKDNLKLDNDDLLSTGDFLFFKINDKLNDQYQFSVMGDVSGNGIFNGNDIVLARRHIVGWKNPRTGEIYEVSGVYENAIDYSMNGEINGNDVSLMRRKLVN